VQARDGTLEQQLLCTMNDKIQDYFVTTRTLSIKNDSGRLKLYERAGEEVSSVAPTEEESSVAPTEEETSSNAAQAPGDGIHFCLARDKELRRFDLGSYVFVRSLAKDQRYRVYEMDEDKGGRRINVEIDVPGCDENMVWECLEQNCGDAGFISITEGSGEGVTIEVRPWLLPRPLPDGATQVSGVVFRDSSMDTLRIDVEKRLRKPEEPMVSVKNGILLLSWTIHKFGPFKRPTESPPKF